jgi:hypothetical protein
MAFTLTCNAQTVQVPPSLPRPAFHVRRLPAPRALGLLETSTIRNKTRETIKDMVDQFIDAYLAVNPKK